MKISYFWGVWAMLAVGWALGASAADETEAIQGRIDEAWRDGGGVVEIAPGVHEVRSLRIRSNVTLHLQTNAVLSASRDLDGYDILASDPLEPVSEPIRHDHWERGVIRFYRATNAALTGDPGSAIDGNNSFDPQGEEHYRGAHGINAFFSTNIVIRGVELRRTGNWANRFHKCGILRFEDLRIRGGHDGVHVRGCDGVAIRRCDMRCGDDCIAGYDNNGVIVEDCTLNTACSAFRFGGTNVRVRRVKVFGPGEWPIRGSLPRADQEAGKDGKDQGRHNLLSFWTYFAGENPSIRNAPGDIVIENCTIVNADRLLHYNLSGNERWQVGAPLSDITFRRVTATGIGMPLNAWGDAKTPLTLRLENCTIGFRSPMSEFLRGAYLKSLDLRDVKVEGVSGPAVRIWKAGELRPELHAEKVTGLKAEVAPGCGDWKVGSI